MRNSCIRKKLRNYPSTDASPKVTINAAERMSFMNAKMQSIPYLFADAVFSQLDSKTFRRAGYDPEFKEFAKSIWRSAFATHRNERQDLKVTVNHTMTGDEVSYYISADVGYGIDSIQSITDNHRLIETNTFNKWHFCRIFEVYFVQLSNIEHCETISLEKLLEFAKLHSSNRVLQSIMIAAPLHERVLQNLNDSQIRMRTLEVRCPPFPGDLDFLLKRSDDSTLEALIPATEFLQSRPVASYLPLLDRFCLTNTGRPRFISADVDVDSQCDIDSTVQRVVDNWQAQPKNHVSIIIFPTFQMDLLEKVTMWMGVTPVVEQEIDQSTRSTFDVYNFRLRHQQENELLKVELTNGNILFDSESI